MGKRKDRITTLGKLRARCKYDHEDSNGCWKWLGATKAKSGHACVHLVVDGEPKVATGSWAALHLSGRTPAPRHRTWTTCKDRTCCNPAHAASGTYAQWGAWMREQDLLKGNPRNTAAAIARARRRSRLTPAAVREVKSSPLPATELATVLSEALQRPVTPHIVRRARNTPTCWAEASPFAGLGAR